MGAKRALIVDDSKSARLFLARILEKFELDVDNAENAEAAIEYLTTHRPDVIFMDHMMPGMDGLQAVQAIKNDPRTATIPIMMCTGSGWRAAQADQTGGCLEGAVPAAPRCR
jgi:CheY-like chemotaxis protein